MAKSPYADVPEPLKSQLPGLFQTYPNLKDTSPSSWIQWGEGIVKSYHSKVCHQDMEWQGPGYDELVTAVPKNDEVSLEYIRMLIRGPFRSVSDLIKLDRIKTNYYLHCLSLSKWPANVLFNFCIASRVPIEFEYLLSPWAKRCELGFDPMLSFLLTYSYGAIDGVQSNERTFKFDRPGHLWFDAASSWSALLSGVMEKQSKPYKTNPGDCKPTNIIWGWSNDYAKLKSMTDEEIAEFYHQPIQVYEQPAPPPPKLGKKPFILGQGAMLHAQQFVAGGNHAPAPLQFVPVPAWGNVVHAAEPDEIILPGWGAVNNLNDPQPDEEPVHDEEDFFPQPGELDNDF